MLITHKYCYNASLTCTKNNQFWKTHAYSIKILDKEKSYFFFVVQLALTEGSNSKPHSLKNNPEPMS